MIIRLFYFFLLMTVQNNEIDSFLGRHIEDIPYEVNLLDSIGFGNEKIYSILNINGEKFYSKPLKNVIIYVDETNIIKKVYTDFKGSFDSKFYNSIVDKYGLPTSISRRVNEKQLESEEIEGTILTETTGTLVECELKDNPDLIIWDSLNIKLTFIIIDELDKIELVMEINK